MNDAIDNAWDAQMEAAWQSLLVARQQVEDDEAEANRITLQAGVDDGTVWQDESRGREAAAMLASGMLEQPL